MVDFELFPFSSLVIRLSGFPASSWISLVIYILLESSAAVSPMEPTWGPEALTLTFAGASLHFLGLLGAW